MELNPKILSNFKYPTPLFKVVHRKQLVKTSNLEDLVGEHKSYSVYVHSYKERQSKYTVPCVAGHYECLHCFLGVSRILKTYAITKDYKGIAEIDEKCYNVCTDLSIICLLSFINGHKCAFALNSFVPLGMYPVGIMPYSDTIIDKMYSLAKNLK
jgi:hypothetical protein